MERRSVLSIAGAVAVLCMSLACVGGGFYVLLEYALGPVVQYGQTLGYTSTVANITAVADTEHGYFCTVHYQYEVGNMTHSGTRTRTLDPNPYRERHRYCRRYNATRQATVWYDPRRPERAALRRTYAGDLWVALNVLDSLALVALGGAMIYYVFHHLAPMYVLCTIHAAAGFISTVPVSIIRLMHRHILAIIPLVSGIVCAAIAAYCALILGGRARARRDFGPGKSNDWWSHPSDFVSGNDEESPYENVFQRDLPRNTPSRPGRQPQDPNSSPEQITSQPAITTTSRQIVTPTSSSVLSADETTENTTTTTTTTTNADQS